MDDDAMRHAIVKACDWVSQPAWNCEHWVCRLKTGELVPDPVRCLNTMHEAEKHLHNDHNGYGSQVYYRNNLAKICGCHADIVFATARQKATAFIIAMNLKVEESCRD